MKTIKLNFLDRIPTEIEVDEDNDLIFATQENSLYCVHCNENFSTKRQVQEHCREFHKNTAYKKDRRKFTRYLCNICSKHFADSWTLKHHKKTVHLAVRDHACQICAKCFLSTKDLKRHVDGVHLKKRILYPSTIRKCQEAQDNSEKGERRGRKKKLKNLEKELGDTGIVNEDSTKNNGSLVEIINVPSTTSLSSLPGTSRNFQNIFSGTFQNLGSSNNAVQNPLTTAAIQPLPLEDFRKVMNPSLSRKSLNEQKRWNLEEIVHNIKVSESGSSSSHINLSAIQPQDVSASRHFASAVQSADTPTKTAVQRRKNRKTVRTAESLDLLSSLLSKDGDSRGFHSKDGLSVLSISREDDHHSTSSKDVLNAISRDEDTRGLPGNMNQLPMFQLDQLDNLPIILPEFNQSHSISQQPSNTVEGDKGIMNNHHTSNNVMQTEGTNEMDGIQIIKLGDSSPQRTALSDIDPNGTMCYFTPLNSSHVSLLTGEDDLNVPDTLDPVKESSGNLIYRMSDSDNNGSEQKITPTSKMEDFREVLFGSSLNNLLDDKRGMIDLSRAPKCEDCNKHFLSEHFLNKHRLQVHQDKVYDLQLPEPPQQSSSTIDEQDYQSVLPPVPSVIPSIPSVTVLNESLSTTTLPSSSIHLTMASFLQSTSISLTMDQSSDQQNSSVEGMSQQVETHETVMVLDDDTDNQNLEEPHQLQEEVVTMVETRESDQQVEDPTNHIIDEIVEQGRKDVDEYEDNAIGIDRDSARYTGKIKLKDGINIEINTTSFVDYKPKENLDHHVDTETDDAGYEKDKDENVAVFTCEDCDLVFKAKSTLTKHRKAEHNLKQRHTCHVCQGGFASEQTLKEHVNVVHNMIANICYICLKPVNDLTRHVRLQHKKKGERKYPCDVCEKSFRTKFACDRHRDQVHLKKKPWACQLCERSFSAKRDVHRHIKIVHFRVPTDSKREWTCPICSTSFSKRGDYDRHKQEDHINSSDTDLLRFVSYELTRKGKGPEPPLVLTAMQ